MANEQPDTKQFRKKPEEAAAIINAAIEKINTGSVEPIDDLLKKL